MLIDGYSLFEVLILRGCVKELEELLKRFKIKPDDKLLEFAITSSSNKCVKFLLDKYFTTKNHAKLNNDTTLLLTCAKNGYYGLIKLLITFYPDLTPDREFIHTLIKNADDVDVIEILDIYNNFEVKAIELKMAIYYRDTTSVYNNLLSRFLTQNSEALIL